MSRRKHRAARRAGTGPAPKARTKPVPKAKRGAGDPAVPDGFYRDLVWNLRNGIVAIMRDGRIAVMNDNAYGILGLKARPSDIGRPFAEVLKDIPDVCRILAGSFDLSHLPNRAELRLKDLDRVIGYTLSQVKDDGGAPIGAVLFFKDLTQVEQLEERERLRDRLASLGEMAAGMAHELRNPLAGIEVMAGLLRRQVPDSIDTQTLLADIISEAKLANAIVVEMLEFVRPVRLQVERTDVVDVLNQAVTLAESKASRGNIEVTVDAAGDLPMIDGDHHQLSQVFINLIANAFEALDGNGHVAISAVTGAIDEDPAFTGAPSTPTPVVIVEVADDGPGVAADLSDRIFNPFFTTKPQGSGLGLAIVRKIVDAHDGRIDLISSPQAGTRFRITIPVTSTSGWFK